MPIAPKRGLHKAEFRNALHYGRMVECLIQGMTYDDIVEETGLCYHTVMRFTRALRARDRIYVCGWATSEGNNGQTKPIWKFTLVPHKDADRPRRSKEYLRETQRRYRAAKKLQVASVFHQHVPRSAGSPRSTT